MALMALIFLAHLTCPACQITKWSEFNPALEKGHMVLAPFCGDVVRD